jgi:Tfp pilus assembly protein PilP
MTMRTAAAITVLLLTSVPTVAQQQPPAGAPAPAATTQKPQAATAGAAAPVAAVEPQGYTYDAGNRRDPFVSLMRRGADTQSKTVGVRPPGLGGLTAGEITLKGILASQGGYVGIVLGADNKTYIIHPGEALLDGTIRTITSDAMVILQQVNEPLSLQKQRELKKVLRQTEEGR